MSLFTRSIGRELNVFTDSGVLSWVGAAWGCPSALPRLECLVLALPPPSPPCPQTDTLSGARALPKRGPRLGKIVGTLDHS